MVATHTADKRNPLNARVGIRMLAGGLLGALMGAGCVKFALYLKVPVTTLRWPDTLALFLGIIFAGLGVVTLLVSFSRKELANNLEGQIAQLPATPEEVRVARVQSVSLFLAGIMLLMPVAAMGAISKIPGGDAITYAAVVVFFTAQTFANLSLWRNGDEFVRSLIAKTAALTFAVCQSALFLWAAAEHLHLAPALSSWEAVDVMMVVYTAAGLWLQFRPGKNS
jgi:hypothetical protein